MLRISGWPNGRPENPAFLHTGYDKLKYPVIEKALYPAGLCSEVLTNKDQTISSVGKHYEEHAMSFEKCTDVPVPIFLQN